MLKNHQKTLFSVIGSRPLYRLHFFFLLSIFLWQCSDPTRDNPLDPLSPHYNHYSAIEGVVWSFYPPYRSIADVVVSVDSDRLQTLSDENGRFFFQRLGKSNHTLVASREGYAPDTLFVDASQAEVHKIEFHLDALPTFFDIRATSRHISRWWPTTDLYILDIRAVVRDEDGPTDIQTVYLKWPGNAQMDTLQLSDLNGQYRLALGNKKLPLPPADIVGLPLRLVATDRPGHENISDVFFLHRIVQEIPVALSPRGLETTGGSPMLKWSATPPAFSYTFWVQLFRDDSGVVTEVWEKKDIPAGQDSIAVTTPLPGGVYFWTVAVVDGFGNSGRSKEAAFQVQ